MINTTATSEASLEAFDRILTHYLGSKNNVMPLLDELLLEDPEMPMAHFSRAYLLKQASDPRLIAPARASLRAGQALPLNPREQLHAAVLEAALAGDSAQSIKLLEHLLNEYPLDVLALRIAHHQHFYAGDSNAMRDSIQRVMDYYPQTHPFHGYVLGMLSFGLEESGEFKQAERLGRLAVEQNPQDQWAAHAVAHVMQMQSRFQEGIHWTGDLLPGYTDSNNFIYHIYWHQALFHLGRGDLEAALSVYDEHLIQPLQDDFYLDVCNAASLLWRIEMLGGQVGDRWQALEASSHRYHDDELIFCTLHYLMAPARLGHADQVAAILDSLHSWKQQNTTQANVVAEVGEPLALAISRLGQGDYASALEQFDSVTDKLDRIGGSHAQRQVFLHMRDWAAASQDT